MPVKVEGSTVLHKKGGKWSVKANASSPEAAQRMANLLRGVEHGWKPTKKQINCRKEYTMKNNDMDKTKTIGQAVKENPLQAIALAVTLGNVAIAVIFAIVAYRLTPLVQDMKLLDSRVLAVEKFDAENTPLIERFIKLEEGTLREHEALNLRLDRFEKTQDRLETKIDNLLSRGVE